MFRCPEYAAHVWLVKGPGPAEWVAVGRGARGRLRCAWPCSGGGGRDGGDDGGLVQLFWVCCKKQKPTLLVLRGCQSKPLTQRELIRKK